MKIPSKYNAAEVEERWYEYWTDQKFFHSKPDEREPYTIVIPPPNVTGVLHMGHMLNNTIQDILVRRARMTGKNACWVPGTDHASIATEAKVVNKLEAEGINKNNITREEFLKHAWEWTHKHGGIILEQLKKLGASCDWDRTAFTMDGIRSRSVIKVFADLYNKGLIYRGVRMVNWDTVAKTALSDEEVIYKEVKSQLYYLKYEIENEEGFVTIATTRPETILGDTALCVNPADKRFFRFKGKRVLVPLINRSIPIIEDDYVDMEFGTGCLKITPAHDINDYEIGLRHNLPIIDIFNDNGTLSEKAEIFIGQDRFVVRGKIVSELEKTGSLYRIEDYTNKVGFSERTDAAIEPKLSMQWFLKMEELVKPALENVLNDKIRFHPPKFKNIYRHWMSNIKDWCISRQLWWGHQIPVYYLAGGNYFCAETIEQALEKARKDTGNNYLTLADLKQDEDVLDTWFSSWLWPISVFNGILHPENEDIKYYYPTSDLVTAPDIIFFWVARMIIAGYEYRKQYPFKNVYFTGMVRDSHRRKMSKSLGNSPDPLELISQYSADGVRVGMLLCSPAGGDLLFDRSLPQQGAGFAMKIWNAFRLVKNWEVSPHIEQPEHSRFAINWFKNKLNQVVKTLDSQFAQFRISEALMTVYNTVRDEFSGWLLEIVKPAYKKAIDEKSYKEIVEILDQLLRLMHPFMPFITEEIWQLLKERKHGDSVMVRQLPKAEKYDPEILSEFENIKETVSGIRKIRKENSIPNKELMELSVQKGDKGYDPKYDCIIKKLGNLSELTSIKKEFKDAVSFRVKSTTFYMDTANLSVTTTTTEDEFVRLNKELKYAKGFLNSVMKKLKNKKFLNNAPEAVVNREKAKKVDAEAQIKILEERIASLK